VLHGEKDLITSPRLCPRMEDKGEEMTLREGYVLSVVTIRVVPYYYETCLFYFLFYY
jgi:hypothetical protein